MTLKFYFEIHTIKLGFLVNKPVDFCAKVLKIFRKGNVFYV